MMLPPSPVPHVGMGELAVAKAPGALEIRGLGSCIALALYDPLQRLAGLAHVVIPRALPNAPPARAWSAPDAVPALIGAMQESGARMGRLVARLAGGSSMFPGIHKGYEVGRANAEAVEAILRRHRIPVLSRQVGGHFSRHVRLHADDGRLDVRSTDLDLAGPRRVGEDPTDAVRTLLQAVAAPLSDMLQRPVVVETAGRHQLDGPQTRAFLGEDAEMRWSQVTYLAGEGLSRLTLALPDAHARRLDEELRSRLSPPVQEDAAIEEVLNIMLSHGLTALSKMQGPPYRPQALVPGRGATRALVAALGLRRGAQTRLAHARMHVEGAFRGAELALLGDGLP